MPTKFNQASQGGELGKNGEFYKGGQFLPSSEKTVKGLIRIPKGSGKKEIAPYIFDYAPADNMLSIWDRISHCVSDNRDSCQYVKGEGFVGFKVTEVHKTRIGTRYDYKKDKWEEVDREPEWIEFISRLAEKFNAGERWYPLSEDPYHYLNQE